VSQKKTERPWENTWGDNSWKFPWNWEGNNHPSPRNPESSKQDKPKAKHPKTHINQIDKNQIQWTSIKSSKGKTTNNTQWDSQRITADLSIETLKAIYLWFHFGFKILDHFHYHIWNSLSGRFPISSSFFFFFLVWWAFILFLYLLGIPLSLHLVYIVVFGVAFPYSGSL